MHQWLDHNNIFHVRHKAVVGSVQLRLRTTYPILLVKRVRAEIGIDPEMAKEFVSTVSHTCVWNGLRNCCHLWFGGITHSGLNLDNRWLGQLRQIGFCSHKPRLPRTERAVIGSRRGPSLSVNVEWTINRSVELTSGKLPYVLNRIRNRSDFFKT